MAARAGKSSGSNQTSQIAILIRLVSRCTFLGSSALRCNGILLFFDQRAALLLTKKVRLFSRALPDFLLLLFQLRLERFALAQQLLLQLLDRVEITARPG